jgi:hypothetical protein
MRIVSATIGLSALLVSSSSSAFGETPTSGRIELSWSAPTECPTEADVSSEVGSLLRASATTGLVEAHAMVTRSTREAGWHVELAIRTESGAADRSFDAGSCHELGSAVAFIVAMTVDPSRRPLEERADIGASTDGSSGERSFVLAASNAGSDGVRIAVAAGGVSDVGTLPKPGLAGGAAIAALYRRVRFELRANMWGTQHAADPGASTQGGRFDLLTVGGRACYALVSTTLAPAREGAAVSACGGLDVNRMSSAGYRPASSAAVARSDDRAWISPEMAALTTWALGSVVALRFDAALLLPLSRPTFAVVGPDGRVNDVLARPSPLAGRFGLAAELRIF